jgi:phosphate starvation-inducible PhoH-like protein|tara:strand:+ start:854 stop:1660 length:807 start_codon:yes stop_codon:yes gene_type:complete
MARKTASRLVSDANVTCEIDEREILDFISPLKKKKIKLDPVKFTEKQKEFLKLSIARNTKAMFIRGPAGTTKTYLAVYSALQLFNINNDYDITYIRTIAESGEKGLGALPGDVSEKFNPFMLPLNDKLEEMISPQDKVFLEQKKIINALPINYLRGANWIDRIIIADESQNFTFKELTTLITRIGKNTKLFICGDPMQSDINGKSGFDRMSDIFNNQESADNGIHCFDFTKEDILRSEILKFIVGKIEESSLSDKPQPIKTKERRKNQ